MQEIGEALEGMTQSEKQVLIGEVDGDPRCIAAKPIRPDISTKM